MMWPFSTVLPVPKSRPAWVRQGTARFRSDHLPRPAEHATSLQGQLEKVLRLPGCGRRLAGPHVPRACPLQLPRSFGARRDRDSATLADAGAGDAPAASAPAPRPHTCARPAPAAAAPCPRAPLSIKFLRAGSGSAESPWRRRQRRRRGRCSGGGCWACCPAAPGWPRSWGACPTAWAGTGTAGAGGERRPGRPWQGRGRGPASLRAGSARSRWRPGPGAPGPGGRRCRGLSGRERLRLGSEGGGSFPYAVLTAGGSARVNQPSPGL